MDCKQNDKKCLKEKKKICNGVDIDVDDFEMRSYVKDFLSRLEEPTTTCPKDDEQYKCCDVEEGKFCKTTWPCKAEIERMETATASDVGFYFAFDFDEETGIPSGCEGFDAEWTKGTYFIAEPIESSNCSNLI